MHTETAPTALIAPASPATPIAFSPSPFAAAIGLTDRALYGEFRKAIRAELARTVTEVRAIRGGEFSAGPRHVLRGRARACVGILAALRGRTFPDTFPPGRDALARQWGGTSLAMGMSHAMTRFGLPAAGITPDDRKAFTAAGGWIVGPAAGAAG